MTATASAAAAIRDALACGRTGCACRSGPNTHCPAHDDRTPSLTVHDAGAGVLVHCKAGCPQAAVIAVLRQHDLWPSATPAPDAGVRRWTYHAPDGAVLAAHCRRDHPDGTKRAMWWEAADGRPSNGRVRPADLPLYRAQDLAAATGPVLLVEGEQCADAATAAGLAAVSLAGGASQTDFGTALDALRGRDVVLVPDNDPQGRALMERVAAHLHGRAASVRLLDLPGLPPKGDIADFLAAGGTAEQVWALIARAQPVAGPDAAGRLRVQPAADLLRLDLPEPRWAVPGLLADGLSILAGRPKLGKSWLALNLAVAVAAGGRALGSLPAEAGPVLVLALEDGIRRLQSRLRAVLAGEPAPATLELATEWRRMGEGGVEDLGAWLRQQMDPRLVVIDTLTKLRPRRASRDQGYSEDYADADALTRLAQQERVAIVVVAHTRKAAADDFIDEVSGTLGLSGGADAIYVLQRERGRADAFLRGTGRDLTDDIDLALRWDDALPGWHIAGSAEDYRRSSQDAAILGVLRELEQPATPKDVAEITGEPYGAVKLRMWRMSRAGSLRAWGGRYVLADETRETRETPDTGEPCNPVTRLDGTQVQETVSSSRVTGVSPVSSVSPVSRVSSVCAACGVRPRLEQLERCASCQADALVRERAAERGPPSGA